MAKPHTPIRAWRHRRAQLGGWRRADPEPNKPRARSPVLERVRSALRLHTTHPAQRRETFPLAAASPCSCRRKPPGEGDHTNKRQPSVERRFAFLQDPVIVDGIHLKRPDRAYTLAFVFLFALLVAAYLERRIRHALAGTQEVLDLGDGRKTSTPTVQAILDLLRSLQIVLIDTGRQVQRLLPDNTDPKICKVLRLAGYSEAIYTQR